LQFAYNYFGGINYVFNINISKGQELLDLKKALDENAVTQSEYDLMKEKIINDVYTKEIIKSTKENVKSNIVI
jgi:hypothetical protein